MTKIPIKQKRKCLECGQVPEIKAGNFDGNSDFCKKCGMPTPKNKTEDWDKIIEEILLGFTQFVDTDEWVMIGTPEKLRKALSVAIRQQIQKVKEEEKWQRENLIFELNEMCEQEKDKVISQERRRIIDGLKEGLKMITTPYMNSKNDPDEYTAQEIKDLILELLEEYEKETN